MLANILIQCLLFYLPHLFYQAHVQVFENEWHNCDHVANLFQMSRCLSPSDRPCLLRLLSLARHNFPLINGEINLPAPLALSQGNFNPLELYEKLMALHLHQQAKELLTSDTIASSEAGFCPIPVYEPVLSESGREPFAADSGSIGSAQVSASNPTLSRPNAPSLAVTAATVPTGQLLKSELEPLSISKPIIGIGSDDQTQVTCV
ncbi:unnamed protein product [Protopolystoma xenopodis]|uniref:Uncharacterized protein n=1 Tax=Protopolystoma xenopodis TaxID=117903 RepID=A0A3S5CKJ6_9PLAT|nr:unnamed protein product [Protopolystoma xenopodis]